jgi:hypothetical protein
LKGSGFRADANIATTGTSIFGYVAGILGLVVAGTNLPSPQNGSHYHLGTDETDETLSALFSVFAQFDSVRHKV